ncbi:MAG: YCF48-related protein [Saprospiraceae bacterium]|nr:YCF48-related protein [Saprospiraceae bacterium]
MKKLLLLFLCIQQFAICQSEDSVFPKVPYTELNAMAVEGNYIYSAGDCNTALISKDAGQTWTTISIEDYAKSIKVVPGTNGEMAFYQFNDGIYIFDSNDLSFEEISSSSLYLSSGNYRTIEVDEEYIYVTSNLNLHRAKVGEYEWEKVADFNFENDAVVVSDITENYIHMGSLYGVLLRVNLTTSELETVNDFMNRIYSFDMVTDDLGYFTIQNFTYPIKTTDGGATYTELEELPENIGVRGYGPDVIMTVNTNRIYVSTDGGQTSTYIPIPDDGTFDLIFASFISEDGTVYFAGRSSMVIKTEDFGQSFINLNEYNREHLEDIEIHPSGLGIAVGGNNSIIKTEDGGENWSIQDVPGYAYDDYMQSVAIISQNKYVVASNSSVTIIENDQAIHSAPVSLDVMHYNKEGDYFIGLRYGFSERSIVKSTDGGMTWETKAFIPNHNYMIAQSPSGKIFIPGQDGIMYTSTDSGDTWDIESFGADINVRHLAFLDDNTALASTGLDLHLTTDGGITTSKISTGYDIRNLHFISAEQIVYTTSNESQTNFYESTDGGQTFVPMDKFCSQTISSFRDEDNVIWMAQRGGHINKYKVESPTSTLDISGNESSLAFTPNPVSMNQSIYFNVDGGINKASVLSISGRELKNFTTVRNNNLSLEGLAPGIYVVLIESENGNIHQGKLVITN